MFLANWREVLTRAWSMWLLYLSIFLGAIEVALPFMHGLLPVRPGVFVVIILVTNILAAFVRLLAQRNMKR